MPTLQQQFEGALRGKRDFNEAVVALVKTARVGVVDLWRECSSHNIVITANGRRVNIQTINEGLLHEAGVKTATALTAQTRIAGQPLEKFLAPCRNILLAAWAWQVGGQLPSAARFSGEVQATLALEANTPDWDVDDDSFDFGDDDDTLPDDPFGDDFGVPLTDEDYDPELDANPA